MSLDIIMGPMFAGKTSRILSIVSRYSSLGTPVLVVKHASDARYGDDELWKQDGVHSEDDPYAMKLWMQELEAMHITPRMVLQ
jgi:thymidine kinase